MARETEQEREARYAHANVLNDAAKRAELFDENGVQQVFAVQRHQDRTVWIETREERIARWEEMGSIVPGCHGCQEVYDHPRLDPFAPRHQNSGCASGGRPHCTCPTCWG